MHSHTLDDDMQSCRLFRVAGIGANHQSTLIYPYIRININRPVYFDAVSADGSMRIRLRFGHAHGQYTPVNKHCTAGALHGPGPAAAAHRGATHGQCGSALLMREWSVPGVLTMPRRTQAPTCYGAGCCCWSGWSPSASASTCMAPRRCCWQAAPRCCSLRCASLTLVCIARVSCLLQQ